MDWINWLGYLMLPVAGLVGYIIGIHRERKNNDNNHYVTGADLRELFKNK